MGESSLYRLCSGVWADRAWPSASAAVITTRLRMRLLLPVIFPNIFPPAVSDLPTSSSSQDEKSRRMQGGADEIVTSCYVV
jgi:hypothetical protein